MPKTKRTKPARGEDSEAGRIPQEEMVKALEGLRTLAAAADFSAEPIGELAALVEDRLGAINGQFAMIDDGAQILRRPLGEDELPLAAAMSATMNLLLSIRLGTAPTDSGAKLRELVRELERYFKVPQVDGEAQKEIDGEARALAVLIQHPDWPDTKIAKEAGVNRTRLYKYPRYTAAKATMGESGKAALPRGYKTKDGDLDAFDD